jgi:hypothetical protein
MIVTNKHGMPQTLVNLARRDKYTKGKAHLSATEMLNSPRIVQLRKKYDDQVEVDVTDLIPSMWGTAMHYMVEQGKADNHIIEQRLHAEIDGWHISGAIDLQTVTPEGIEISDWKNVGVWAVMNEKVEWEQQLNIYAWLVEEVAKKPVTKLSIVAIVNNWNKRDAKSKEGYPPARGIVLDIKLWPFEERLKFIRGRIHAHSEGQFSTDAGEELPLCTPADMWEKPTSYAVKKEGGVRAKSVHADLQEAEEALLKAGAGYTLEIRQGERTRCDEYCSVNKWCDQYQNYLKRDK